ncbi:hypothetical Protein YC6258_05012 [Gynuella sunshinyii YC6258]|uniref:Uncharacterized protein n=1 Tax=Gynuella sunshinyii YC6258 TaxID=1445510 RepID=A0A0C5W301_9GAMM|nr:hypothetical Protein YC6258_05012 [Gynuella sunshinyii YC6258]
MLLALIPFFNASVMFIVKVFRYSVGQCKINQLLWYRQYDYSH